MWICIDKIKKKNCTLVMRIPMKVGILHFHPTCFGICNAVNRISRWIFNGAVLAHLHFYIVLRYSQVAQSVYVILMREDSQSLSFSVRVAKSPSDLRTTLGCWGRILSSGYLINLGKMCGRKHGLGFPWSKFGNEIKKYYYPGDAAFIDCSHQAVDVFRQICAWYGEEVHEGAACETELDLETKLPTAHMNRIST